MAKDPSSSIARKLRRSGAARRSQGELVAIADYLSAHPIGEAFGRRSMSSSRSSMSSNQTCCTYQMSAASEYPSRNRGRPWPSVARRLCAKRLEVIPDDRVEDRVTRIAADGWQTSQSVLDATHSTDGERAACRKQKGTPEGRPLRGLPEINARRGNIVATV